MKLKINKPSKAKATIKKQLLGSSSSKQSNQCPLICLILEGMRLQPILHKFHLNERSYARHRALDMYKDLPEVIDELAEGVMNYNFDSLPEFTSSCVYNSPEHALEELRNMVDRVDASMDVCRGTAKVLDDLYILINTTLYKLKRLS